MTRQPQTRSLWCPTLESPDRACLPSTHSAERPHGSHHTVVGGGVQGLGEGFLSGRLACCWAAKVDLVGHCLRGAAIRAYDKPSEVRRFRRAFDRRTTTGVRGLGYDSADGLGLCAGGNSRTRQGRQASLGRVTLTVGKADVLARRLGSGRARLGSSPPRQVAAYLY